MKFFKRNKESSNTLKEKSKTLKVYKVSSIEEKWESGLKTKEVCDVLFYQNR